MDGGAHRPALAKTSFVCGRGEKYFPPAGINQEGGARNIFYQLFLTLLSFFSWAGVEEKINHYFFCHPPPSSPSGAANFFCSKKIMTTNKFYSGKI